MAVLLSILLLGGCSTPARQNDRSLAAEERGLEGARIIKWEQMKLSPATFEALEAKLGPKSAELRLYAERTGDSTVSLVYEYGPCGGRVNVPGTKVVYGIDIVSIQLDIQEPKGTLAPTGVPTIRNPNSESEELISNGCRLALAIAKLELETTEPIGDREIRASLTK